MKCFVFLFLFGCALVMPVGCAHKTRLDCIEICKARGLNFEGVVATTEGYDPVERNVKTGDACRCGYGEVPR